MTRGRYEVVVAGRLGPITVRRFSDYTIEERREVRVVVGGVDDARRVMELLTRSAGVTGVLLVSGPDAEPVHEGDERG